MFSLLEALPFGTKSIDAINEVSAGSSKLMNILGGERKCPSSWRQLNNEGCCTYVDCCPDDGNPETCHAFCKEKNIEKNCDNEFELSGT